MIENLVEELARTLGSWAYVLVGLMAFLETAFFVGLVAPGEFAMVLGGVLAGEGTISVYILIGVVWFCAIAGDSVSFLLGCKLGRGFILKHGPRVRITRDRLAQVEAYFSRHGGKTILVGRFIGIVRAMAPFIAGTSGMPYRRFLPYDILGTGLWGAAFVLLGFFFWQSFGQVVEVAGTSTLLFGVLVFAVIAAVVAKKQLRDPVKRLKCKNFLKLAASKPPLKQLITLCRPAVRYVFVPTYRLILRPAWVAIRVQAKFLFDRVTPGGLGLEFTTLLAVAAVGIYVVALYMSLLSGDLGPTTGDRAASDIATGLQTPWLTEVMKIVTVFGSVEVVAAASFVAVVVFLWRRFTIEAITLVTGLAITWGGVFLIKAAYDRPRPVDTLIEVTGDSFPSGHAALACAYVAIAIMAVRAGLGPWSGTAVVTTAVCLAVAISLTRVYLGVHYLSDVTSGLAFGAAAFSVAGMGGLLTGYIRGHKRSVTKNAEPDGNL